MTDLLLVNGNIRTLDPARPRARSLACADGKIESLDETPPAKRVMDLEGRTVVPGFVDAHAHLLKYGMQKRELDLTGVTDYAELIRRVSERARERPPGTWITDMKQLPDMWLSPGKSPDGELHTPTPAPQSA